MSSTKVYYSESLVLAVLNSSSITSAQQVHGNDTLSAGVLDNTIGKYRVLDEFGAENVKLYATCREAVAALENGEIDVFVTNDEFASNMELYNNTVRKVADETYFSYDHVIFASGEKAELIEKLSPYVVAGDINKYENINSAGRVYASQSTVTIAPGGMACVELIAESFYTDKAYVNVGYNSFETQVKTINGSRYLFITVPEHAISSTISFKGGGGTSAEGEITVNVSKNASKYYQYDGAGNVLDFGAFTGTAPDDTVFDLENDAVIHTYLVYDLWNNGVTDVSILDAYLTALENDGYVYVGYEEIENTVALGFVNEEKEQVVTYVEGYDSDGYIVVIGIGYMLSACFK